jgi:sterol desaturase/sphingolipid hydroxylase (fatty acid hydroxylase superfamily)
MPRLHLLLGMIILLFAIAAGCILVERLWPAMELPRVHAWWPRVLLINAIQLGIVVLAGETWNRWLAHASLLHLSRHFNDLAAAGFAYFISTFVYYWWHRFRHESQFFWRLCHQLHHSPRRIEILTSFYKHPVEILLNSLLSSAIVYTLLGCSVPAAAYYTFLTAIAEYFYHWNIKTPRWFGYLVQRPESHRIHHQYRHHTQNFADLPIWDWLFGTLQNPHRFTAKCGFDDWREDQFEDLLAFRDVHAPSGEKERQPLQFLPTCIGCRKRWACAAARQEALS